MQELRFHPYPLRYSSDRSLLYHWEILLQMNKMWGQTALRLQDQMCIRDSIMIGLYVHLCCLVERLVTKTPIDNYQDLEEFEQKHADFIRQVRDSFQDISRHYRVALPVSEIAYIYDYMHLNSKNKLSGQAESPAVREDE